MIQVKHLKKVFNGVTILKDVNATINKGDVISIIGPSGTGKSTFMRCLNLLEQPDGGEILIDGENILAPGVNVPLMRRKMGMVFQQFNLFGHLTVLENITLAPCSLLGKSKEEAQAKAMQLLKLVGLANKANALPSELSGGQQQRVAIARALAMEPEIILFDEPTSALDPTMVNEVLVVMKKLAESGITMLIVTHEMRFARDVSTRIFYMDEGVVYEEGPSKEMFENPKRKKTRAFLRRISTLNFTLSQKDFDLYHFLGSVVEFAERQMLTPKQSHFLQLVLEELLVNIIFPQVNSIELELGISEANHSSEIQLLWDGPDANPMDSEVEAAELARMIVTSRSTDISYSTTEDGKRQLKLTIPGE